jgi:hypothetical protein
MERQQSVRPLKSQTLTKSVLDKSIDINDCSNFNTSRRNLSRELVVPAKKPQESSAEKKNGLTVSCHDQPSSLQKTDINPKISYDMFGKRLLQHQMSVNEKSKLPKNVISLSKKRLVDKTLKANPQKTPIRNSTATRQDPRPEKTDRTTKEKYLDSQDSNLSDRDPIGKFCKNQTVVPLTAEFITKMRARYNTEENETHLACIRLGIGECAIDKNGTDKHGTDKKNCRLKNLSLFKDRSRMKQIGYEKSESWSRFVPKIPLIGILMKQLDG